MASQSIQGQALDITVVGCYNLRNKEWFTKQDPYVVMEYSGQNFSTQADRDGGKNPSFNETFKIALIEGLREINATVWNRNHIERDDYIGTTKILLRKVIESGYDDSQWPLTDSRSRKSAGTLKLILHYAGARTKPGKSEGTSYPPPAPAAPPPYGQATPPYGPPQGYQPESAYPPGPQGGYDPPPQPYYRPAVYPPPARPAYYPPAPAPSAPPYYPPYPPAASSGYYPPSGYP